MSKHYTIIISVMRFVKKTKSVTLCPAPPTAAADYHVYCSVGKGSKMNAAQAV